MITRYAVPEAEFADFLSQGRAALQALTGRPGCTGGWLARAVDEPGRWLLATSWEAIGAYRRALSSIEVRTAAVPLMHRAEDEPSAFEDLVTWTPAGGLADHETAIPDGLARALGTQPTTQPFTQPTTQPTRDRRTAAAGGNDAGGPSSGASPDR